MDQRYLDEIDRAFDRHPGIPMTIAYALSYGRALLAEVKRLRAAARKIEEKRDAVIHETHSYDPDTGAWECSNAETAAFVEALDGAIELLGSPHRSNRLTCATCATGPVPNAAHCRDCRIHDALVNHWTPKPQPSGFQQESQP